MLDKKYFKAIREDVLSYSGKRREVIDGANAAQHLAKKAIFALQRDDLKGASACLEEAQMNLVKLYDKYSKDHRLIDEGSYRAGVEEYVEAAIFNQFITGKPIGKIEGSEVDPDIFIGGLCDVPGELLRFAVKSATERNFEMVKKCYDTAEEIIGELVDMDLTGYNRNKFDQAKGALHKLQQVVYEVSLRQT